MLVFSENWRLRRSVLFVPAANSRAIDKVATLDCDAVIFDLEDSVGSGEKAGARNNLARGALERAGHREGIVRVTATTHDDFEPDLEVALRCKPDAILVPKVNGPADLETVRRRAGGSKPAIWAMIETPAAIVELRDIAQAGRALGLTALVVGPNDLALATGTAMTPDRAPYIPWLMNIIAAARANGLAPIDGVCNDFRDLDRLEAECRQGATLGFDGKTLIHPSQIAAANSAFRPSRNELRRARAIVDAFADEKNRAKGVLSLEGEMIELLHLAAARKLLAVAKRHKW